MINGKLRRFGTVGKENVGKFVASLGSHGYPYSLDVRKDGTRVVGLSIHESDRNEYDRKNIELRPTSQKGYEIVTGSDVWSIHFPDKYIKEAVYAANRSI